MQEKHGKGKRKEKARERVERKGRTPLGVVTWLYTPMQSSSCGAPSPQAESR